MGSYTLTFICWRDLRKLKGLLDHKVIVICVVLLQLLDVWLFAKLSTYEFFIKDPFQLRFSR